MADSSRWNTAALLLACALYFAMALHGVADKSSTYDELAHVTAGYSYWTLDDYRLDPENGNWSQRIAALPLLYTRPAFPSLQQNVWRAANVWNVSEQFFFAQGNDADHMLRSARAAIAVVGVLLCVLVFAWSRTLFGLAGAWISTCVFVFSPTLLAHGALATSDLIGAAFFTAASWTLWTVLHRITPRTVTLSVLATAGVMLTKHSGPVFGLFALAMLAVRLVGGRVLIVEWRQRRLELRERSVQARVLALLALAHVAMVFVLIWGSYGFRYSAFSGDHPSDQGFLDPWSRVLPDSAVSSPLINWGREHHVLPEAYLYGVATVSAYAKNRVSFLNGRATPNGSRWFFPCAALVKTTIPGLILVAAMGLMVVTRVARRSSARFAHIRMTFADSLGGLYELTPLLVLIVGYWTLVLANPLAIGHRHLLPVVPATIILLGGLGRLVRTRVSGGIVAALLMWHAAESIRVAPNYLAYFNELAGGPKEGYRHLVDSSLDWGQDLPALKHWLDDQGLQSRGHPPLYLSYFGTALPEHYGIEAERLPGFPERGASREPKPLTAGVYCISATMLQAVYLRAWGAWSELYEADYQGMRDNLAVFDSTATNPFARSALLRQTGDAYWMQLFDAYEQFRLARLVAWLRRRSPDAQAGYSILIYKVSNDELQKALFGPAPIE